MQGPGIGKRAEQEGLQPLAVCVTQGVWCFCMDGSVRLRSRCDRQIDHNVFPDLQNCRVSTALQEAAETGVCGCAGQFDEGECRWADRLSRRIQPELHKTVSMREKRAVA